MRKIIFGTLLIPILFWSCNKETEYPQDTTSGSLVQVSVIDALLQGIYDGCYSTGNLLKHGNTGIGTFHALDGEMMILNDTAFQILSSGEVLVPDTSILTPFASITEFRADATYPVTNFTFDSLRNRFDQYFPTKNLFYVIKIKGKFSQMHTRSVPRQEKPYPPLSEVTANQPEFHFENVTGDLVGFYCPEFAKGINVTGMHLHFLTGDRKGGGHILDFILDSGSLEIGYIYDYRLILPEEGDFFGGDFSVDRQDELEEVEGK